MKKESLYLLFAGVLLGFIIGLLVPKKVDTSEFEAKIALLKEEINIYERREVKLLQNENDLADSLHLIKEAYRSYVENTKTSWKLETLLNDEIRKGQKRYDFNDKHLEKQVKASIYGNLAFDELTIMDKRLENSQKVATTKSGIVDLHEDIGKINIKMNKVRSNQEKERNVKTFFAGFGSGAGALAILLLLL